MPRASVGRPGTRQNARQSIAAHAREYGAEAIETLVKAMRNGTNDNIKLDAANKLLDRGYGKSTEHLNVSNKSVDELTDQEIAARIAELRGIGASGEVGEPPLDPSQLN